MTAEKIWQNWLDAHDRSDLPCDGDCARCEKESIAFGVCEKNHADVKRDGWTGTIVGIIMRMDKSPDIAVEFRVKRDDGRVMRYYSNDPGVLKQFYGWVEAAAVPF
jgi:hypothetical protein